MLSRILATVLILSCSLPTLANQILHDGVLQAYWLPIWNDEGTQNTPRLEYRYFSLKNGTQLDKIINLEVSSNDFQEVQLKEYFHNIPENFIKSKEGHIEQNGVLVVDKISKSKECDHNFSNAQLVKFTPMKTPEIDIQKLENSAGCESYPYLITYSLQPNITGLHFKMAPQTEAKNGEPIPVNTPLVKIKMEDSRWVWVAVYDESKPDLLGSPQGYVEIDKLQPIN